MGKKLQVNTWLALFMGLFITCMATSSEAKKPSKPPPGNGGGDAEIVKGPYLQNATSDSIVVMWEATSDVDSLVEFGTSQSLGTIVDSVAPTPISNNFIHEVTLSGLSPNNVYHYKVLTGTAESAIHHFKTLTPIGAGGTVRIAVYSDTQKNKGAQNKHGEIVNDGIIGYVNNTLGMDIADGLDMVLVAGDLVDKGYSDKDWKEFFGEILPLGRHVPYFTITGNHEYNNSRYFKYMSLPENGSAGFEENWYYVDVGNVRIIGIDSNKYYENEEEQFTWLGQVLGDAETNSDIDVVIAQLHHPLVSEMWLEGETAFTARVVDMLEEFSRASLKPSMHLTGHMHGYSRGQSPDALHSWITVASAEGSIDYWGDYDNADRAEIEVSLPEWGFMIIEVDDIGVHVKRVSRGNDVVFKDNEIVDHFSILFGNNAPNAPVDLSAAPTGAAGEVSLAASTFNDVDQVNAISYCHTPGQFDGHIESQFQVSADMSFSTTLADTLIRFENLYSPPGARGERNGYFSEVTCVPDMTSVVMDGLPEATQLFFKVRYRDDSLGWSAWSQPLEFTL